MSDNQVLESNTPDLTNNVETQPKPQLVPVVYSSLLSKLRQNSKPDETQQEQNIQNNNNNNNNTNHPNIRGFKKSGQKFNKSQQTDQIQQTQQTQQTHQTQQTQQGFQRSTKNKKQKYSKEKPQGKPQQTQRYPRLSPEEYKEELKNCQKAFFVHLVKYLKEEFVVEQKLDDDKKKEVKIIKKTKLERIQNGYGVNVMRLFLNKGENSQEQKYIDDLKYLDNLVSNRQMDFVNTLSIYMSKYGLATSFRGKNNIMIHSPYLVV